MKRFVAPLLVFIFGMTAPVFDIAPGASQREDFESPDNYFWCATTVFPTSAAAGAATAAGRRFSLLLSMTLLSLVLLFLLLLRLLPSCAAGWPAGLPPLFSATSTITSWRPSIFGNCSTTPCSRRSSRTRSSSRMPNSWCAISRPRNRNVTLRLVAFVEEPRQVAQLDLVIAFVRAGTKLHFLDDDLLLLELRLVPLLALTVLELTVIHDAANRRLRRRGDFHQIQLGRFGHLVGGGYRLTMPTCSPFASDQADFGSVDLAVDAGFFFLSYMNNPAISKSYAARPSCCASSCRRLTKSLIGIGRGLRLCGFARQLSAPPLSLSPKMT